ncbi:MAG TPA: hypothetical protein VLV84_05285 [Candidatus Acidoferrales bacterium]|nr:hypothetical protein [Candidatus Acidoferrales bacterium]
MTRIPSHVRDPLLTSAQLAKHKVRRERYTDPVSDASSPYPIFGKASRLRQWLTTCRPSVIYAPASQIFPLGSVPTYLILNQPSTIAFR